MSSVVISGNTSGTVTLFAPDVSGTTVLTLPTANGTVLTTANTFAAGTGPAFSAYMSANQTGLSNGTNTKLLFDTEEYDTNSNFASSRFTPTVAGYYQVIGGWQALATQTWLGTQLFKNGSQYRQLYFSGTASTGAGYGSALIYLNGTTDYIELYAYNNSGSSATAVGSGGGLYTYFQASMVRSA